MSDIISGSGGGCFRAGTNVLQEHGKTTPIDKLSIGDSVLSFTATGEIQLSKVIAVHAHRSPEPLIRVTFWNGYIDITPNHWVLNQYGSFVEVAKLTTEDAFVDGMGHLRPIISMESIEPEPVWNLTVEPNHTFIANGIRVHNGGYRERFPTISGSGGGGGKGGGGSRTPVESPDSLHSKQYARVVDLVSEGEIEGLVNGLNSVYLDGTPIQAKDGSFNFTGVSLTQRTGTQTQPTIPGFSTVETEVTVGVEVISGGPVVRTITSTNIDAARITVGIPGLSFQDLTNGDTTGTSVSLKIDVNNNGGGWLPAKLRSAAVAIPVSGNTASTGSTPITSATVSLFWTGIKPASTGFYFGVTPPNPIQYCNWDLQYRETPSGTWTTFVSGVYSGTAKFIKSYRRNIVWEAPTSGGTYVRSNQWNNKTPDLIIPETGSVILPEGTYEFRAIITSGVGTLSIVSATGYRWYPDDIITGKTTSRYQKSYRLDLPKPGPWDIRVSRITPDSTISNLRNKTFWDSYTEVIDSKLRYPNSAIMAIAVDSEQFNTIPNRGYDIKGLKVLIPSNYNPITRVYSGIWDGTFTVAWTDNPAWCFYDLITNDRYGLGSFINPDQIDKWSLYTIAQYCDQMVPDGFGSEEPRFTCNLYLQTREDAYKVVNSMASIFRGIVYWSAGSIVTVQDAPASPVALYSPANIINGQFSYQGSSAKARHTVVLVSWNDPSDAYKQKIEYVEDAEGINRFGVIQSELLAVGCTSRGQAHRIGKWLLYTERLESEIITFRTGLDGTLVNPGEIIKTTDPTRAGERLGGRISSVAGTQVTLDTEVVIEGGQTYTIWVELISGEVESREVVSAPATLSTLQVASAFSDAVQTDAMWVLSSTSLVPETWRVISVVETAEHQAEITALAYKENKYLEVEYNLQLDSFPTSNFKEIPEAPTVGRIQDTIYTNGATISTKLLVSWETSPSTYKYYIKYKANNENWVELPEITNNSAEVFNVTDGYTYTFRIYARSSLGQTSPDYLELIHTVLGKKALPSNVTNFNASINKQGVLLTWTENTDIDRSDYGIVQGTSWGSDVTWVAGTSYSLLPTTVGTHTYKIRSRDTTGNLSTGNSVNISRGSPAIVTLESHGYVNNSPIRFETTDTLPIGIFSGIDYFVSVIDTNNFSIKTSPSSSLVSTSDFGEGIHYITRDVLVTFTVSPPATVVPQVDTVSLTNTGNLILSWEEPTADFQIAGYEIRYGDNYSTATSVGSINARTFSVKAAWSGSRKWWVVATDIAGNTGTPGSINIEVHLASINNFTGQVIDNNVLLYWDASAGNLPIDTFEFRKGSTWDSASIIGTKTGEFTSLFETVSGIYTYWIAPIDTAGNTGIPKSTTLSVSQPPDFVLQSNIISTLSGTKVNIAFEDGRYILPINTTESYEGHFTSNSWPTPQSQVDAGYPVYAQPTPTTAKYTELLDYGTILAANKITIVLNSLPIVGTINSTCTISTSVDNVTWIDYIDTWSVYASNFRYVKVTLDFTSTNSTYLMELVGLNITLDAKFKSISHSNIKCIAGVSGTYSQSGTSITITAAGTWTIGQYVDLAFSTGTATSGIYTITTGGSGSFSVVSSTSATTSGNCTIDSEGTPVFLTVDRSPSGEKVFVDIEAIQVSPIGTTAITAVCNFVDTPHPLFYKILLFNSSGVRQAGLCSTTIRGV